MPNFESPIGGRSFPENNLREFSVSDETGYSSSQHSHQHHHQEQDLNKNIKSFQNKMQQSFEDDNASKLEKELANKRLGRDKINDGARRRIEMLLGMTQLTKEFTIEDNSFTLRTLKSKEMRDSIMEASNFDGTVQAPYEIRRQLLARALTHVAGIEIEQFISSNTLESKLLFIDELDEALLNRIYNEYLILNKESKEKYSLKEDADVKEVVEDIKKS
jgi:hypothetical protein